MHLDSLPLYKKTPEKLMMKVTEPNCDEGKLVNKNKTGKKRGSHFWSYKKE